MVKKKVSLGSNHDLESDARDGTGQGLPSNRAATVDVLELFFDTGIILHDVALPRGLPDTVSSFVAAAPILRTPGSSILQSAPTLISPPTARRISERCE